MSHNDCTASLTVALIALGDAKQYEPNIAALLSSVGLEVKEYQISNEINEREKTISELKAQSACLVLVEPDFAIDPTSQLFVSEIEGVLETSIYTTSEWTTSGSDYIDKGVKKIPSFSATREDWHKVNHSVIIDYLDAKLVTHGVLCQLYKAVTAKHKTDQIRYLTKYQEVNASAYRQQQNGDVVPVPQVIESVPEPETYSVARLKEFSRKRRGEIEKDLSSEASDMVLRFWTKVHQNVMDQHRENWVDEDQENRTAMLTHLSEEDLKQKWEAAKKDCMEESTKQVIDAELNEVDKMQTYQQFKRTGLYRFITAAEKWGLGPVAAFMPLTSKLKPIIIEGRIEHEIAKAKRDDLIAKKLLMTSQLRNDQEVLESLGIETAYDKRGELRKEAMEVDKATWQKVFARVFQEHVVSSMPEWIDVASVSPNKDMVREWIRKVYDEFKTEQAVVALVIAMFVGAIWWTVG